MPSIDRALKLHAEVPASGAKFKENRSIARECMQQIANCMQFAYSDPMVESRHGTEANKSDGISRTDYVVLQLREMLLRGDFHPGERLTEMTLSARLGASRTPVRLALDRLAHEGLLKA